MIRPTPPSFRRLRIYAFDPGLATQLDTAMINETVLRVRWEENLQLGPVGEYLEVVDYDPATGCFYAPVDLNEPRVLAQDGLAPSEGNPHFHQQMVYAVAMTTIHHFELALGRKALWSPYFQRDENDKVIEVERVERLRIYPHAMREANAYYSPDKKALLFGYFPATLANPAENLPGGLVFTCLSHDVVAHETTHALLDGLHRYFNEPSNPDVLAFHEAFADIVALFQHFTQPEALRHQLARTRGDLASHENLLGELAHQFGQAIGNHGALRDAIGHYNEETGKWEPDEPDPEDYAATTEPHARGAILVAAMFDAFLSVYKSRVADLLRIATGGTGVLPEGNIHPDLVNRVADEATEAAAYILRMAIRALDYCPPVDITFGEYLRALITGDWDLVPDDQRGYRIAVIEAFRRRGIYPPKVRTLAADSLRWEQPPDWLSRAPEQDDEKPAFFADLIYKLKTGRNPADDRSNGSGPSKNGTPISTLEWQTAGSRVEVDRLNHEYQKATHGWLKEQLADPKHGPRLASDLGLVVDKKAPHTIYRIGTPLLPSFEVHSVRSARRPLQDGRTIIDLVIELTQRRRGYLNPETQKKAERQDIEGSHWENKYRPDFKFRGGCTLIINGENGALRYCIAKSVGSDTRLARQRAFCGGPETPSLRATYVRSMGAVKEPFALLHRSTW